MSRALARKFVANPAWLLDIPRMSLCVTGEHRVPKSDTGRRFPECCDSRYQFPSQATNVHL